MPLELTQKKIDSVLRLPPRVRDPVLAQIREIEFNRCADSPMYWLDPDRHGGIPYVYTTDPKPLFSCKMCDPELSYGKFNFASHLRHSHQIEHKMTDRELESYFVPLPVVRPFPIKPYIEPLVQTWLDHQFFAVEKSRDMMATWLMVALYTWDTMFHPGRQNLFISRESVKTRDIIKRAFIIHTHTPKWLVGPHKATFTQGPNKAGVLDIPTLGSEILGFPQGPDQIRTYHPTGVFMDEAAFQEQAGAAFASIKPAVQDGGRITMISSANPSFFERVCRDNLDEDEG